MNKAVIAGSSRLIEIDKLSKVYLFDSFLEHRKKLKKNVILDAFVDSDSRSAARNPAPCKPPAMDPFLLKELQLRQHKLNHEMRGVVLSH